MVDHLTCGAAVWPETALKNKNNANSAELSRARYYDPAATAFMERAPKGGPRTKFVIPGGINRNGFVAPGFLDDFYNRLHMSPVVIDAGLIVSAVSYNVWFFNAWLNKPINFTAINTGAPAGLNIDFDLPYTLSRFTGRQITITFLEQGPPTQNTEILFINNGGNKVLPVFGRRLTDFYPEPAWGDDFELTVGYNTVLTRLGRQKEQRRPLSNYPTWQISCNFWDIKQKGRDISGMFKTGLNRMVSLPLFTAGVRVLGVINSRQIRVSDISRNWWFVRQAQTVTLIDDRNKERQILSVAAIDTANGVITFIEELKLVYVAEAYPCVQAYYTAASARQITHDLLTWSATLKVYAYGAEPLRGLPAPPEVFPFAFNFANSLRQTPEITRGVTFAPGGIEIISPLITYPYDTFEGTVTLLSQADEFKFLDFFTGVKGRHKAFTLYNPAVMFETVREARAGAAFIRVKGNKNNILNLKRPLRFYVLGPGLVRPVILADTLHPRDDGDSDMYLTTPCPTDISAGSLLGLACTARLNSDDATIKYTAPGKASVSLSFKEIDE